MTTRRNFIQKTALFTAALTAPNIALYSNMKSSVFSNAATPKISLAQWSLHKAFFAKELDPLQFASIASKQYDINAVEYVAAFYKDQSKNEKFWSQMKTTASNEGVENLLLMIDDEGLLGDPKKKARDIAVENHFKWIHAAKLMGCHSNREVLKSNLVDGLGQLTAYGAKENIHILIENHGLHTSDGAFIVDLIKAVDNPYLGTLPDFGNWCMNKEWGGTQNNSCSEIYDPYQGLADFLPYAKGVSAKAYDFDGDGDQIDVDYPKLLKLVKDTGYQGFIGIEYEGEKMSEADGIRATKALIEKVWASL